MIAEEATERIPLQVFIKHTSPGFAPESTYFAQPHGPEHLDQLLVPSPDQVHDALNSVGRLDLVQGYRAFVSTQALIAEAAFESENQGNIDRYGIRTTQYCLGDVLGQGNAPGRDKGDPASRAVPH